MTSSTLPIPTASDVPAPEARDDGACDACQHPSAEHDAIAARFCSATMNGAITRGCVCRS